ncbi:MAG: DUF2914 domain-containing protein [Patescibacteria group bacterium]
MFAWAARNERHLGAAAFVFGFATDLVTFTVLSVAYANLVFAGYLTLATVAVLLSSLVPRSREYLNQWMRGLSIIAPLAAQYAIGGMLSGFMIFYTKSAELSASWPFLLLLAAVFVGNEFFRLQYKYLAFQLGLLYFALYGYLIFALPLFLGRLGPDVFLMSTGASLAVFAVFLYVLRRINRLELMRSLRYLLPGAVATLLLVNVAYFTGALPPIPLTMPESGIYHSLARVEGRYVAMSEPARAWYKVWEPRLLHTAGGTSLYAFTSVAAPIKFGTTVTHRWEWYDKNIGSWVTKSRIEFPISGGRPGGYRGYSVYAPTEAGEWRVSVETRNGQVIGRVPFTLVITDTIPEFHEVTH